MFRYYIYTKIVEVVKKKGINRMVRKNILVVIFGLLTILFHISAHAEGLILTAPPRETAAKGQKMYGPIAEMI